MNISLIGWTGSAIERGQLQARNTFCVEGTEKMQPVVVLDAVSRQQVPKVIIRQPTAAEVSGLTFGVCVSRIDAQEVSNEFARLLNRGSSLE